jgi:hypothetical protein
VILPLLLPLLWASLGDSTVQDSVLTRPAWPDTAGIPRLPATTVLGVRTAKPSRVDPEDWAVHAGAGQSGPLETLRDRPGISSQGEFSGQFSSTGMPFEGNLVTWDGAEIPWPWHFGGLFGVLDASAVGEVSWDPSGEGPSPARGGGWLRTQSKAASPQDEGFHGSVEAGTIDGALDAWGRRGDWSFQVGGRRTWLDPALQLAHHEGWSPEELTIFFWDADAAVAWNHGPWSARAGIFASEDSLSVGSLDSLDGFVSSWRNTVAPASLTFRQDGLMVGSDVSYSEYTRIDDELSATDTLDLLSVSTRAEYDVDVNFRLSGGIRLRRWTSEYAESGKRVPDFPGDGSRNLLEPWVSTAFKGKEWNASGWVSIAHDERDAAAPQGGGRLSWSPGAWNLQADLFRKLVPLSVLGSVTDGTEMPSPVWFLPPGASPRTTSLQISALRSETGARGAPSTEFRALGWLRSTEGLWGWEGVWDVQPPPILLRTPFREDAGSAGLDLSGRIVLERLALSARQTVSWDVIQRRPQDGTSFPRQWAPWDQRFQTEFDGSWAWMGGARSPPGTAFLRSRLCLHDNSGTLRPDVAGWTFPSPGQDLDTTSVYRRRIFEPRRAPYFRLDITPVEFGREGSWSAFWSIVNCTSRRNSMGWISDDPAVAPKEIDQIPFLPVVFGVRFLF